ncbi:hypothetical protein BOW53_15515 [Solemya pervernicosa gill symbiont]|uniref:RapA2 cadherin-like domain-containing protein n=1 Tax=Solemya pervernicosa gill symbiont TaxID=642797 RepID=A0A1T2L035_9GAMM|nr:hypothetical protein [Solemya pervernicosa gill symbiont]OOZ38465.1 hypothetical protein BOW53_15515 [Solemya pervernicosa gill symbiont]
MELNTQGDEADVDGTVDAYVVQAVSGGTLTINGSAYVATTNDTIDSLKSASWTPPSNANGTLNAFTVKAKDDSGDLSSTAVQATVTVNAVNDAPSGSGNITLTGTDEDDTPSGSPIIKVGSASASNIIDDYITGAADIDGDTVGIAIVGVTGNGTWKFWYWDGSHNYIAFDQGGVPSENNTHVATMTITAVNDAPTVNLDANDSSGAGGNDYTTSFSAGGSAVTIADTDASVADVDVGDQIASMTATLTARPDGDGVESLSLNAAATTVASGLTVGYTVGTGVLSVSGNATSATYQSILRGVQYNNTDAAVDITTGSRTVNVVVNDGALSSATATATVSVVTAPVVTLPAASYTEGDGNKPIAGGATVTEPDGDNLNLMTITLTLTNPLDAGETINLSGGAGAKGVGITATYTSATVITLSGSDTDNNYEAALQELRYSNSSENPDTTTRSITVVGRDVNGNSGATSTLSLSLSVTAVNDPLVGDVTISGGQTPPVVADVLGAP